MVSSVAGTTYDAVLTRLPDDAWTGPDLALVPSPPPEGGPRVRPAEEQDREFLHSLFCEALSEHYDGDHDAHADRVLDAHLAGGIDRHGHFSLLQRTFVLTEGAERIGLIHLVYKRQQTVKISPLIVTPRARSRGGNGRALLDAAQRFAAECGARQLYCTVAETNRPALEFFRRNGFVVAGSAFEQYKSGVHELMLYRDLTAGDDEDTRAPVTVRALEDGDVPAVAALVLSAFDPVCSGIGTDWVDALVAAHGRRHGRDVNAKFKDVHVAVDPHGEVRGVAASGPKKGGSVKVMPMCAVDPDALSALLSELPHTACPLGGRLYAHQPPDPQVARVLQRHGWEVDAVLPGAYRDDQCMVQWSVRVRPSAGTAPAAVGDGRTAPLFPLPRTAGDDRDRNGGAMSDLQNYAERLFAFVAERDWARFENPKNLAMALGGECGELLELLQWLDGDEAQRRVGEPEFRREFGHELADILNYLLRLARNADIDLLAVAEEKLAINERRYPADAVRGRTTKYTELPGNGS